jgi:hypothetical protein
MALPAMLPVVALLAAAAVCCSAANVVPIRIEYPTPRHSVAGDFVDMRVMLPRAAADIAAGRPLELCLELDDQVRCCRCTPCVVPPCLPGRGPRLCATMLPDSAPVWQLRWR